MAKQLLMFADPRLIKIVMKDDEIVGFLFGYPDPSAAIQRCKGRLFPIGWLDILIELKRTKWINLNGAGLIEKYRGSGGTALLFAEMYKSVRDGHYLYWMWCKLARRTTRCSARLPAWALISTRCIGCIERRCRRIKGRDERQRDGGKERTA